MHYENNKIDTMHLVANIVLLYFPAIFCSTTVIYKNVEDDISPTEKTIIPKKVIDESDRQIELNSLTTLMKSIDGQLEKFNTLYLGRLDEKLTSLAANVASLDSNVRNIQERAHVWDTFQLHVAAWNEQIKSLDRKVNIISSGQEKMLNLDAKLASLPSIEFTTQKILNEVSGLQVRIETLGKSVSSISVNDKSLYSEFATRGMLATLKSIEGKVDSGRIEIRKLFTNGRHGYERLHRNKFINETVISQHKKLVVRCSTPPVIEELVKDMSSKVDLMYDKIAADNSSDDDEQPQDDVSDEVDQDYSVEMYQSDDSRSHEKEMKLNKAEVRAVKKLRKQLKQSSKEKFDIVLEKYCSQTAVALNSFSKEQEKYKNKIHNMFHELQNTSKNIYENSQMVRKILNDRQCIKTDDNFTYYDKQIKSIRDEFKNILETCFEVTKYENSSPFDPDIKTSSDNDTFYGRTTTEEDIQIIPTDHIEETTIISRVFKGITQPNTSPDVQESFTSTTLKDITTPEDRFINEKCLARWDLYENNDAFFDDVDDLACYILFSGFGEDYELNLCNRSGSERYCTPDGFVTIQSRKDDSVNFTRDWSDYTFGFGNLVSGNFWLGNEVIHILTTRYNMTTLKVDLEDFDRDHVWAQFEIFEVSSRETAYALKVADYSGNASDSLSYHSGSRFSTFDQTNDRAPSCCPCSQYGGGWWFDSCFESNLNGVYYDKPTNALYRGIIWEHWRGEKSLAATKMAIKYIDKHDTGEIPAPEDP